MALAVDATRRIGECVEMDGYGYTSKRVVNGEASQERGRDHRRQKGIKCDAVTNQQMDRIDDERSHTRNGA